MSRVKFHWKSLCLSMLFLLNLVLMPLKPYLTEVSPIEPENKYRPSYLTAVNTSEEQTQACWMSQMYNASTMTLDTLYFVDSLRIVEVMRTVAPNEICSDEAELANIVDAVRGIIFFTPAFKQSLTVRWGCGGATPTPYQHLPPQVWLLTLGSIPVSTSVAWVVPENEGTTVYYAYMPGIKSQAWRLTILCFRLVASVWIFHLSIAGYYNHVRHLRGNLDAFPLHGYTKASRYEIVVGEPTCIVLANPWLCLWFLLDLVTNTEYIGMACLRVCQINNLVYFCLGMLYLGRTVWCGYTALAVLNILLKRRHKAHWVKPTNTTILALAASLAGGGIMYIQTEWQEHLDMYFTLYVVHYVSDTHETTTMETAPAMLVYALSMTMLPFAIAATQHVANFLLHHWKLCRAGRITSMLISSARHSLTRSMMVSPTMPEAPRHTHQSQCEYNDVKHRVVLWLCGLTKLKPRHFTGGSIYSLFRAAPGYQAQCTLSQRGGDCYILCYDSSDRLLECTRVTLVSQVDLAHQTQLLQQKTTSAAVGRVVLGLDRNHGSTVMELFQGERNSPWIA
ncbi:hypothetical protein H257_08947 [Aphanomyces astaci]|uniref:Intimal thickness related receptor IRP domain-containing protein n=1 Tax=Aphanomyces astaci TaxID=112090 RepID=W4GCM2_APHAT|nr:hypothetical protein H257_08947 [Aphanomyces astaci]ETV77031.1 hypothetical protein H257_08947 [Aphanomyces astaci]|eukprot:XP_009833337.1 hypothetical protein H257_08947 [Aphanomyces astaci]